MPSKANKVKWSVILVKDVSVLAVVVMPSVIQVVPLNQYKLRLLEITEPISCLVYCTEIVTGLLKPGNSVPVCETVKSKKRSMPANSPDGKGDL